MHVTNETFYGFTVPTVFYRFLRFNKWRYTNLKDNSGFFRERSIEGSYGYVICACVIGLEPYPVLFFIKIIEMHVKCSLVIMPRCKPILK